jgi:hypothetical protein
MRIKRTSIRAVFLPRTAWPPRGFLSVGYTFISRAALLVAGFLSMGCHKSSTASQINGYNYPISGIAYIKSYYNNVSDSVVLRNKPVYIDTTLGTDTASHFYQVSTTTDGSFTFYIPDTTRKYRLFTVCYDTSSSAFVPLYYGAVQIGPPYESNPVYILTASIDTFAVNGLLVYTVDSNRHILPKVNVILYTSGIVAGGDSTLSGTQAFRQITTDSLGKAFVAGVPADSLYVSARILLNGGKDTIQQFNVGIKVPARGVFYDSVMLR